MFISFFSALLTGILCCCLLAFLCFLHIVLRAKKPRLHGKPGGYLRLKAQQHFSFLLKPYRPPWWVQNGIIMAIVRRLQVIPPLPFSREIVEFPDGGIIALDWLHPPEASDDSTILILLPGVVGHTYDGPYLINPAKEAFSKKWRVLVLNRRGLDLPLKSPKMILWNYLARHSQDGLLDLGISVSAPFDGGASADSMMTLFPKLCVLPWLVESLVRSTLPHEDVLKGLVDYKRLRKSRTIRDFEGCFTAPLAGYDDLDRYYADTALHTKVHQIQIPFLVLTSEDDCFVPLKYVPLEQFEESENVICVVTAHGGHTAFMETSDINACGLVEKILFEWAGLNLEKDSD